MKRKGDKNKQEIFARALEGKHIPILTLDNKWYRLLTAETRMSVSGVEKKLNDLLKRQGKLNTESKEIRRLKKKLMNEILELVNETEESPNAESEKKIEKNKRLVEECNEKLEAYQDELKELPGEIDALNLQLMLRTMECCYDIMQDNTEEIRKISEWVEEIRELLKQRLVQKQEMEVRNQAIYSYMHDLFGAEVIDIFDMQYNPDGNATDRGGDEKK